MSDKREIIHKRFEGLSVRETNLIIECMNEAVAPVLVELKYMLKGAEDAARFHGNDPDKNEDILNCRAVIKNAEQK